MTKSQKFSAALREAKARLKAAVLERERLLKRLAKLDHDIPNLQRIIQAFGGPGLPTNARHSPTASGESEAIISSFPAGMEAAPLPQEPPDLDSLPGMEDSAAWK